LLADLRWFASKTRWGFKCRITIAEGSEHVPAASEWWVLVEPNYPWGDIRFYPATENSITGTFPHQKYNGFEVEQWRSGELCLRTPLFLLGRKSYDVDPIGQPERLLWHFERAKKWIEDAARGTLLSPGDAYELPAFPKLIDAPPSVATLEDESTYSTWSASQALCGTVEIVELHSNNRTTFVATRFSDLKNEIVAYPIGTYLTAGDPEKFLGIWIRTDAAPVFAPYQVPRTWGELRDASPALWHLLEQVSGSVRDGLPHVLLVGFPVPLIVGEPPTQMHWQPIRLPVLSYGEQHADGFRAKTAQGYWRRDIMEGLRSSEPIDWHDAENWSKRQANARGQFSGALTSQFLGVLGVGAIGSYVSELLVRGGVDRALLIDGEPLSNGNLCRHTLGMGSIDRPKALAVAARLNAVRATSHIDGIHASFPKLKAASIERLQECSLIVDCTGSDEVLHELEAFPWTSEKLFCSIAVGYHAKRVYVYCGRGMGMPFEDFQQRIAPWLERDLADFAGVEPHRESAGCWHISFPARIDHITMAAAAAVRCLDDWAENGFASCGLHVFEQDNDGIRRVDFSSGAL
jgi:hypothetical protein